MLVCYSCRYGSGKFLGYISMLNIALIECSITGLFIFIVHSFFKFRASTVRFNEVVRVAFVGCSQASESCYLTAGRFQILCRAWKGVKMQKALQEGIRMEIRGESKVGEEIGRDSVEMEETETGNREEPL